MFRALYCSITWTCVCCLAIHTKSLKQRVKFDLPACWHIFSLHFTVQYSIWLPSAAFLSVIQGGGILYLSIPPFPPPHEETQHTYQPRALDIGSFLPENFIGCSSWAPTSSCRSRYTTSDFSPFLPPSLFLSLSLTHSLHSSKKFHFERCSLAYLAPFLPLSLSL